MSIWYTWSNIALWFFNFTFVEVCNLEIYISRICRAGLVQLVSASSPSHQVLGSKPSLCRISAGVRLYFGYSLPQTPLVWEPLALGLPFFFIYLVYTWSNIALWLLNFIFLEVCNLEIYVSYFINIDFFL
jgi:hypothetical protein